MFLNFANHLEAGHKKGHALYLALREAIQSAQLTAGSKLPSTRELANQYKLSRGTVCTVYETLWADGLVETVQGRGTFVLEAAESKITSVESHLALPLSNWALAHEQTKVKQASQAALHFGVRNVGFLNFPHAEWQTALREGQRRLAYLTSEGECDPRGDRLLRSTIAAHLSRTRGLPLTEEDICVVSGSTEALHLLFRLLLNPGDTVVLENPGFTALVQLAKSCAAKVLPEEVDEEGLCVKNWNAKLAVVTPAHQFPSGVVISRARRAALMQWAAQNNALIIEDDYDAEFRRSGPPLEPLQRMAGSQRVAFIGSFSRTISPYLRLGFAVVPPSLREAFISAKLMSHHQGSPGMLEQAGLAAFMQSGSYAKHLRRTTRYLKQNYALATECFSAALPDLFQWTDSQVGTHLFGYWKESQHLLDSLAAHCFRSGLSWVDPTTNFHKNSRPAAIFGLTHIQPKEIEKAARIMKRWNHRQ